MSPWSFDRPLGVICTCSKICVVAARELLFRGWYRSLEIRDQMWGAESEMAPSKLYHPPEERDEQVSRRSTGTA
jgi:hypothetical protein